MGEQYLGKLDSHDPLYDILIASAFSDVKNPRFHVTQTSSRMVYKYTEEHTKCALIGKFYHPDETHHDKMIRIKGEYDILRRIRAHGLDRFPNYVVNPLQKSERIGLALIEEFICGKDLDYYLKKAVYEGKGSALKEILGRLATFLFVLHRNTESSERVNLDDTVFYFLKIVDKLSRQRVIADSTRKSLFRFMERWCCTGLFDTVRNVILHGDATPTNFLFTDKGDVVAIDLERSKNGDPAFDVSMVCGELKHGFLCRTGNPYAAEPYIRHFLKSYARHFPDASAAFREITKRNPFYMALTELRIARNSYLDWNYRQRLVYEARECLKWGLKLL